MNLPHLIWHYRPPARQLGPYRSMMAFVLFVFSFCLTMSGCALHETIAPTPLMPAQLAANAAVLIEDHLEDPALDAVESSPLELLADLVSAPAHLFSTGLTVQITTLWSVGEWLFGSAPSPQARYSEVTDWIGPRWASAPPPEPSAPSPTPTMDDWRRTRGWICY